MSEVEIISHLFHFTGSESYHKLTLSALKFTDGAAALAKICECFWLMDIIASYQSPKLDEATTGFQVWTLNMTPGKKYMATVICDDGNGKVVVKQKIRYTDFPLSNGVVLYCCDNVVLLPSEY